MHKTAEQVNFGDLSLHIWLHRASEEQADENQTQNIRQLGHSDLWCKIQHAVFPSPSVRAADLIAQRAVRRAGLSLDSRTIGYRAKSYRAIEL